ncbi:MAG: hypothetical protein U1F06_02100 [Steroidobacteraceae bacterium]
MSILVCFLGLDAKAILAVVGGRFDPRYLWARLRWCSASGWCWWSTRGTLLLVTFAVCIGIGFGGGMAGA